jgi:N-acyl amino acid synthase of PEP-CTERM/exosortase system
MIREQLREHVERASEAFDVVVADTPELRSEAYRLRYQVYCIERGYEPGSDGIEKDEHDDYAGNVLLIHRASDTVVGTVRVVPLLRNPGCEFPMLKACQPDLLRHLPMRTTGEVSRFAISKLRRLSCRDHTLVRLGLMQGIVALSEEMGLTHWCAIMEPFLLRLLQMNAIYFSPLGPVVDYHGMRQPTFGHIRTVLDRIRREQSDVWNYITANGKLWYESERALLVA